MDRLKEDITRVEFWKAAGIRAARTAAQVAVATIGTTALFEEVNWAIVGSSSLLAAIMSILMAIAFGLPETEV